MKVCISSTGNNLESIIDPRFGRCPFFIIVDIQTEKFEAIPNPGANFGGGAGIAAAQLIASQNVEAIISGNFGPNAFEVLQSAKIKIYPGVFNLTVKQGIEKFKNNQLQESSQPSGPNYMGMPNDTSPKRGSGRNFGKGQSRGGRGLGGGNKRR